MRLTKNGIKYTYDGDKLLREVHPGYAKYKLGTAIGAWSINAGMAVGTAAVGLAGAIGLGLTSSLIVGLATGVIVTIGICVAGAYAIYCLGGALDSGWEWIKEQIFE